MSRQSRQKADVGARIDTLEEILKSQGEQLNKLYTLVSKIKSDFDNLVGISGSKTPRLQAVYGVPTKGPNPWALQTSLSLTQAMRVADDEIIGKRLDRLFETYKPTIEALRSNPKGLTADETREITGRSRNTESTYLWRLYLSGYLIRKRSQRKVVYKLKDARELGQVFGER